MPSLPAAKAVAYLPHLLAGMEEFRINNELRVAAFLGQLAEESMQLTHFSENLNYSAKRLMQVWPKRFPTWALAEQFAHNPVALANKVYGGRMGNTAPGDGWKYRGRGPMQATGKDMYELLSELLDIDLVSNPDPLLDPAIAFRAAAAIFARVKNCNALADGLIHSPGNFTIITKRINGGTTGLSSRLVFYKRARAILPDNLQIVGEQVVYAPPTTDEEIDQMVEALHPNSTANNGDPAGSLEDTQSPTLNTVGSPEPEAVAVPGAVAGAGEDKAEHATELTAQNELGTLQVPTVNQQDVTKPAQINEPAPYQGVGFWGVIKRDLSFATGGNLSFSGFSEYASQASGWPPWIVAIIGKVAVGLLIATVVYFIFRVIHYLVDTHKKNKRTAHEIDAQTAVDRRDIEWIKP